MKTPRSECGENFFRLNVIGIWLCENCYQVNKPAYSKQTQSKEPQKPRADSALVKAVRAENSEEKAQNKRNPLVLRSAVSINDRLRRVVDDNLRIDVLHTLKLLNLPSALHAQNRFHRYLLPAEFAEFHSRLKPVLKRLRSVSVRINLDVARRDNRDVLREILLRVRLRLCKIALRNLLWIGLVKITLWLIKITLRLGKITLSRLWNLVRVAAGVNFTRYGVRPALTLRFA